MKYLKVNATVSKRPIKVKDVSGKYYLAYPGVVTVIDIRDMEGIAIDFNIDVRLCEVSGNVDGFIRSEIRLRILQAKEVFFMKMSQEEVVIYEPNNKIKLPI